MATIHCATPQSGPRPQKRSGEGLGDRAAKRRSSRACLSCRCRKVRCDVVNGGVPCTNCRLDSVECVLKETGRGRKPYGASTSARPAASTASPQSPTPRQPQEQQQQPTPPQPTNAADYLVALTFEDQDCSSQSGELDDDSQDDTHQGDRHLQHSANGSSGPPGQFNAASVSSQTSQRAAVHTHRDQTVLSTGGTLGDGASGQPPTSLPSYIRPPPKHLDQSDIDYLIKKGAFTVPDDELRDELLRTYIKIIHCFMPAIDLDQLLDPIIRGDGHEPVSLLLFQAIMFASVIFVDSNLLRSRGFASRKAARKVFFNRVRLLYALDYEPDHLALLQSALLMTYWYDSPHDEKDTWYWMGIALSLAQVLGIHRDPDTLPISSREKRLRRRIWWSCYIRDRLLALGIRRPARIRPRDFNVPMLKIDDFNISQPTPEQTAFIGACSLTAPEADRRTVMCEICVELAKLCVCAGNILHTQYSVISNKSSSSGWYRTAAVVPCRSDKQRSDLAKCDAELEGWLQSRKPTCRYSAPQSPAPHASASVGELSSDWGLNITRLHQALLYMIYLTVVGALHRPQALGSSISGPDSPHNSASENNSARKIKDAAIAMTRLGYDLQSENHLCYLSTSSIPAFLSATLVNLLDVRNSRNEETRSLAIGRFYQCLHILHELRDMYASADYAIRYLGTVLERMDTRIPMLTTLRLFANSMVENAGSSAPSNASHLPRMSNDNNGNINSHQPMQNMRLHSGTRLGSPSVDESLLPNNTMGNMTTENINDAQQVDSGAEPVSQLTHVTADQLLSDTIPMDVWNDIDGLLPELVNFDADLHVGLSNHDTNRTATPWEPFT